MATVNQKTIVLCLSVVLVAGTLGFDWANTLFPSAEAHGVQAQLQSRFVRIEDETFNRQSLQTGEILTIQGRLVSLVERDLRGWISISTESADGGNRWEIVARDPPGNFDIAGNQSFVNPDTGTEDPPGNFDIAGNSVIPYSISARALDEGVYHVHTQLNIESVGPGLGPGQTVVVEGEPIIKPAPSDSMAVSMPSGGASDDPPMFQIDPEAEATALAEGYDLRQIANITGHLTDLVVVSEILAQDLGTPSLSVAYTQHPSSLELPDTVMLVIQLLDSSDTAGAVVQISEWLLSSITPDIIQEVGATDEFAEVLGSIGEVNLTEWTTGSLDAAGLGDEAFILTVGGSVEDQEFQMQQIVFSRDRLVISVYSVGLSEEDTITVAAELDYRAAQMVQPEPAPMEMPVVPATPQPDGSGGTDAGGKAPAFTSVGAGDRHTCGVRDDGSVECWGSNQRWDGLFVGQAMPPEGVFVLVSAGYEHTCGVRDDGSVECWGSNQRRDGLFVGQATPPGGTFLSVSSAHEYACGVRDDGSVECWGSNEHGRARPPDGAFASVSAGERHACGVRDDGSVECWGLGWWPGATLPEGAFLSVSAGYEYTCGVRDNGTAECWGDDQHGQATPPEGVFVSVSAGYEHACGVRDDGSVECWGSDSAYGFFAGQAMPPEGAFVSVSAGYGHTCGVRDDGTAECWGDDRFGKTRTPDQPTPAPETTRSGEGLGPFASVSSGTIHSCGVRTNGSVICWGSNEDWYGSFTGQATPPGGPFVSIDAGDFHTCGVRDDGSVECWGSNEGEYGSFTGQATPLGFSFNSVSAGHDHTCGVRDDGSVECWGSNEGEYGSFTGQATPPEGTFQSVSAGYEYTCGVRDDGSVECWGSNEGNYKATPPEGTFLSVSAGDRHACGVRDDGSVECWGSNQIWGGHFVGQATPPEGTFLSVSAGREHTCGVRDDGSVECWGSNEDWYGSFAGQATPPEGTFVSVSAGYVHTCGVEAGGAVVCWGDSGYGQATPPEVPPVAHTPHDDHANTGMGATPMTVGISEVGTLDYARDADFFVFEAEEGSIYRMGVLSGLREPMLVLYDADVRPLASPDGSAYGHIPSIVWKAPQTGSHHLSVAGISGDTGPYVLFIAPYEGTDDYPNTVREAGPIPVDEDVRGKLDYHGDMDVFAFEVEKDGPYRIAVSSEALTNPMATLYDAGGEELASGDGQRHPLASLIRWDALAANQYYVEITGEGTGSYTLAILPDVGDDHGNLLEEASFVEVRDVIEGALDYAGDVDFFVFEAEEGESHIITVTVEDTQANYSMGIGIYGPGGHSWHVSSGGNGGLVESAFLEHEISGRYYIGIDGSLDSADGAYMLFIAPAIVPFPYSSTVVLTPPPAH